jgi:hypothetical protein
MASQVASDALSLSKGLLCARRHLSGDLNTAMRRIKALIYILLGGMVAYSYMQRDNLVMAIFISVFTLLVVALTLSNIGRMKISWDEAGIRINVFPKKPVAIRWRELEKINLDHLGYHVKATTGQFRIRKEAMPEDLLKRIKENIRRNKKDSV